MSITKDKRAKSKHWCLTINNPEEETDSFWNPALMKYLILAHEVGENNTPHLQGYCIFINRKHLSGVKKVFPRAHLEIKKGKISEAATYCRKDGKFTEWGDIPEDNPGPQANKRKWESAYDSAKQGDFKDIPKDMLVRYYHAFKRIRQDNPPKVDRLGVRHNYWIIAPSGHGKSTYARTKWPNFYDKAPNKWWTGYLGQPSVICDDFGPQQCQFLGWYMKRWADVFPFPAETKGGGATIRPKNIIVTSQYSIDECFQDEKVRIAIENRFEVVHLEHYSKRIDNMLSRNLLSVD